MGVCIHAWQHHHFIRIQDNMKLNRSYVCSSWMDIYFGILTVIYSNEGNIERESNFFIAINCFSCFYSLNTLFYFLLTVTQLLKDMILFGRIFLSMCLLYFFVLIFVSCTSIPSFLHLNALQMFKIFIFSALLESLASTWQWWSWSYRYILRVLYYKIGVWVKSLKVVYISVLKVCLKQILLNQLMISRVLSGLQFFLNLRLDWYKCRRHIGQSKYLYIAFKNKS